jgi:hypothetical protein
VFRAPLGGLRDPSNSNADLREAFDAAGYEWVTSHVYRKTVATLMDAAGLSAGAAADQLGHAKVSMTQGNYMGRRIASMGAGRVLEAINDPPPRHRQLCGLSVVTITVVTTGRAADLVVLLPRLDSNQQPCDWPTSVRVTPRHNSAQLWPSILPIWNHSSANPNTDRCPSFLMDKTCVDHGYDDH